jgi:CheY-like chemotaxis protein
LLADDSPHAQRMGERILREEGYEVVSVTDGDTALLRLDDVDPDVILADVFLPSRSAIEICRFVKADPRLRHVRIVATAGLLEAFDEEETRQAGADAIIRKPFEASAMIAAIKPLVQESRAVRSAPPSEAVRAPEPAPASTEEEPEPVAAASAPVMATTEEAPAAVARLAPDPERVRAAVTLALDAAMPALIEELTAKVLLALEKND